MKNPFYFGKEVSGSAFTDRETEVKELLSDMEQGINIIIYSPRRYGKTSLIKKALESAKAKGILVFYLDLFPVTNIKDFVEIYARALSAGNPPSRAKEFVKQMGRFLPRLLPRVVLKPDGSVEISFDLDKVEKEKEIILEDLLEAAYKMGKDRKRPAVVVFDEFQEIAKLQEADKLERKIRTAMQKHQNVSYVFLGSKRHLMQEMFKNKNRPLYNSGRHFPLNKISAADFSSFIKEGFKKTGIKIADREIGEILQITECHPYYTQLFCHLLWDVCRDNGEIAAKDIKSTLSQLIREEEHSYSILWDDFSAVQRSIIKALAREESLPLFSQAFLAKYGLKSVSAVQKAVKTMEKKEFIERGNGHYVICDLFFKKWILNLIGSV